MTVIRIGRRLIARAPMTISPSGADRSLMGPMEVPARSLLSESMLYAAMKNGICSSSDTELFRTLSGL